MRPFDWLPLLRDRRIPYIERGPNVKRGEVNIKCPWCGAADPSQHMGINLETGWYACWRVNPGHGGKSPVRLLMMLLRVGYSEAREIAGLGADYVDPEGFDALAARLLRGEAPPGKQVRKSAEFLAWDKYFVDIRDDVRSRRWWNYLYAKRGFRAEDIVPLCRQYQLKAARGGRWDARLVIPYFVEGRLVSWTGRAIGESAVRYLDLSIEESIVPPKHCLLNGDCGLDPKRHTLVVVEGPLDVLKIDYYGRRRGVRAVGLSTASIGDDQLYQLEELAGLFEQTVVMMDNKTDFGTVDSMRMKQDLGTLPGVRIMPTPYGRGDPGELEPEQVVRWSYELTGAVS